MQVLLHGHPVELGADFQMSFRALSVAAHADIGAGAPLSPVRQFAAENTNTNTNTKYTCDTGQTRNKLLEQWVHLTNHTAGHSNKATAPERSSRRPSRAIICWPAFCGTVKTIVEKYRSLIQPCG